MKNNFKFISAFAFAAFAGIITANATTVYWTGASSSSWSNSANWDVGTVGSGTHSLPTSTDDVDITSSSNNPLLDATVTIASLSIEDGATLTCQSGDNLTVNGSVTLVNTSTGSTLIIGGNTTIITGSLTGGGTLDISDPVSGTSILEVAGDFKPGSVTYSQAGTSQLILNGSSNQNFQVGTSVGIDYLDIENTAGVTLQCNLEIDQDFTGSGKMSAGTYDIDFYGTNMTISTFIAQTSTMHLWGFYGTQFINSYTFYKVDQNNIETDLNGDVTISNNINFVTGNVVCGNYKLIIDPAATLTGAGITTGYVVTNGSGSLEMDATTSGVSYPVGGSSSEYNAIKLTPGTGPITCDVSVKDHVYDKTGTQVTDYAVDATWIVLPHSNASFGIQTHWTDNSSGGALNIDPNQELTSFDHTSAYLSYRTTGYTGSGTWTPIGVATTASGSDPYDLTATTTLAMSGAGATTYYIATGTDGTNSFSPLPVTFTAFNAAYTNGNGVLNWQTASEINNSRFEVERSMNGLNWENVGQVQGHGTTQEINNYTFTDNLAGVPAGVVYYRLRQVDYNGTFSYSVIRSIKMTAGAAVSMLIYPNPSTDLVNISYATTEANSMIRITDMNGMEVYSEKISETGNIHRQVSTVAYPAGTYFVQVIANNNSTTNLLIKK